jgi:hypothetical protein
MAKGKRTDNNLQNTTQKTKNRARTWNNRYIRNAQSEKIEKPNNFRKSLGASNQRA